MTLTIADVLAIPAVAAGKPVVVVGVEMLGRPVRWVHVAPPSGGRRLLLGGELLLSTGVGWPAEPGALGAYVDELAAAEVAGLVLELGDRYDNPPPALVAACDRAGLPLVALRQEVRFVSITEEVHSRIIDAQTEALRERDRVHGVFAELNRRGCSATFLLDQAARMLQRPVVLEDLNHRAVAWSVLGREPATLLTGWAASSRRAAQQAVACPEPYERTRRWSDAGWLRTPVEAQGQQWGTLVALECVDIPDSAEVVLENAALALSLGRLSGGDDEWAALGQRHLVDSLLTGSYVSLSDLEVAFEANGLRVADRDLVAVARRTGRGGVRAHLQQVRRRAAALDVDVLCSPWADEPRTTALFVLSFRRGRADLDDAVLTLLEGPPGETAPPPSVVAVGSVVSSFGDMLRSAEEAISLLQATPLRSPERTVVYRSRTAALDMLLNRKRSDPAVQQFVERVLGPLLAHDAEHHTGLLAVARACVEHPTNRRRAAAACHMSRSVFYQRLQVIEDLLGERLDDGHTLAALHVALVAYGQRANPVET
jgi:purine catabolism regulator